MSLPTGIEFTYQGTSQLFLYRMGNITNALPDMFSQIRKCGLEASTRGVKKIRICEKMEAGLNLASYDPAADQVNIYPMAWQSGARVDISFYAGFGLRHWLRNVQPVNRVLWLKKAVFCDPRSYKNVSSWFTGQHDYSTILQGAKTADTRLITWAIIQLLRDGGVDHRDLASMNISSSPMVADFIAGRKPYSLKPLITRFGGGQFNVSSYEGAFSSYVAHGGKIALTDPSASAALTDLFRRVSATSLGGHGTVR